MKIKERPNKVRIFHCVNNEVKMALLFYYVTQLCRVELLNNHSKRYYVIQSTTQNQQKLSSIKNICRILLPNIKNLKKA